MAQSDTQKKIVGRVMHEFKHGELDSETGGKIRNPKQAIAIALNEAGASNRQSPAANKRRLAKTKKQQSGQTPRESGPTRAALYDEATRKGIAGRSRMGKAELQKALQATK